MTCTARCCHVFCRCGVDLWRLGAARLTVDLLIVALHLPPDSQSLLGPFLALALDLWPLRGCPATSHYLQTMDAARRGVCWLAAAPKTRWQYANRDGRDRSSRGRRNLVRCDRWLTDVTCRSHCRPLTPKRAHYLVHLAQMRITRCAGRPCHLAAPCCESHGAGCQRPSLPVAGANASRAGGLERCLFTSPGCPGGRSRFRHSFWRPA